MAEILNDYETQRFGKLVLFLCSGEGRESPTGLGVVAEVRCLSPLT
jgi:hypothetical protein